MSCTELCAILLRQVICGSRVCPIASALAGLKRCGPAVYVFLTNDNALLGLCNRQMHLHRAAILVRTQGLSQR